jgi:hypothetical protein
MPSLLARWDVRMMRDDALWELHATPSPGGRQGEVDPRGHRIRELVEEERCGVTEDTFPLAPQPEDDELLEGMGREMAQPEDAPARALQLTGGEVVLKKRETESSLFRLAATEEARLSSKCLK